MEKVERIGVSLEKNLLKGFDKVIKQKGYPSRSEALRDLIRQYISAEKLANPDTNAVAAVCMVYDHHATQLMQKLTSLQHSHLLETICSTHIHLDAHDCMEIIILRGKVADINEMADKLISIKGVKLGKVNMISAGPHQH